MAAVLRPANIFVLCVFVVCASSHEVKSENECNQEIEETLRTLLNTQENSSIQLQALRRELLRRFQEALERADMEDERSYKRSLASLAAWNNLPAQKKNVEALARAGYIKTLPEKEDEDPDANYKRSIATLAKNGQLPMQHDDQKRGIEALARNGDLLRRRDYQDLLDDLYDKRNIGSLARNYNFPNYGGKRSVSSLARAGNLPYAFKRNIASLARDGQFTGKRYMAEGYGSGVPKQDPVEKRNLQSIKAQYKPKFKRSASDRSKREAGADYYDDDTAAASEYMSPIYQNNNVYDYEDLVQGLEGIYPSRPDKRFLGSVVRSGWFRTPSSSRFVGQPDKRHLGSLARLGWLPSYRSIRRFNRSGRSTNSVNDTCRETTTDGQTKNNPITKIPSLPLEDKRYLLQPAVDNIILRKIFMHPRSH